jgi:hypothetical protein
MVFTQGSTAHAFVPQNNVCGRQEILTTRNGQTERVYTEESPCQSFYDSKVVDNVHGDCQTCWKRALQLDQTCPCALRKKGKEGICELTQCVSAHPTQCQNTYGAMFQQFSADELYECSNSNTKGPSKESFEKEPSVKPSIPLAFWLSLGLVAALLLVRMWTGYRK